MQRGTALTLVMAAAFFHGVTAARAAEATEQPKAAALEVGGGPRQRWDCVAFSWGADIYVVNLDGSGLTRLTANDARDHSPAFSPDGTKIAYVSTDEKHCAVYVMNVDGSDKRRLSPPYDVPEPEVDTYEDIAALCGAGGDVGPVFAPDGEIIAATRVFPAMGPWEYEIIFFPTSGGPEENFYTKIEDAWERKRHTFKTGSPPSRDIGDLTFSGDGRRVAFRAYPGVSGKQLWIANADGSGARLLTDGPVYYHALSPDGKKVAFCELPGEGWRFCVINADGTGERLLAKGDLDSFNCSSPAFSPDGKKIIYAYDGDIYLMDADGTRRLLTSGDRYNDNPAFSPDGKKIVYESSVRRERGPVASDIYIMNVDGSEPRALTRTPEDEGGARFTADGSKIVFFVWWPWDDDYAESRIYVMNADGSGRRFLVDDDDFSLGPSLVEGRLLDSYGNWHDVVDDPEAPRGE